MKNLLVILTVLFSINTFAQQQNNLSLYDFANLIQAKENNTKNAVQEFTKKYDMQCDKISTGFIRCDQYVDDEPFPFIMTFQNNKEKIVAYVTESDLPLKKGSQTPVCKDAGNYPKICYLPEATNKEKTQLYKYYITMMQAAN